MNAVDVTLRCWLRAQPGALSGPAWHVRLVVEDVSVADCAATPVSVRHVFVGSREELAGPHDLPARLTEGRRYSLRVHVGRSANEGIMTGDLVSATSNPLMVRGGLAEIEVPLVSVRPPPPEPVVDGHLRPGADPWTAGLGLEPGAPDWS